MLTWTVLLSASGPLHCALYTLTPTWNCPPPTHTHTAHLHSLVPVWNLLQPWGWGSGGRPQTSFVLSPRSALPSERDGTAGRTSIQSVPGWPVPCPSLRPPPELASTASNSPRRSEQAPGTPAKSCREERMARLWPVLCPCKGPLLSTLWTPGIAILMAWGPFLTLQLNRCCWKDRK